VRTKLLTSPASARGSDRATHRLVCRDRIESAVDRRCTNFINTSANAFSDPMLLPITPVRLTGSMEYEQNIFAKKAKRKTKANK
jgi:hypothetical protein